MISFRFKKQHSRSSEGSELSKKLRLDEDLETPQTPRRTPPRTPPRTPRRASAQARDSIRYKLLERQPLGWVRVYHSFAIDKEIRLELWYTPDHHVLDGISARHWLLHYKDWSSGLEDLTIQLMDDFRNEIVPCWVRLRLCSGKDYVVEAEDRQPNWSPQRVSKLSDTFKI